MLKATMVVRKIEQLNRRRGWKRGLEAFRVNKMAIAV